MKKIYLLIFIYIVGHSRLLRSKFVFGLKELKRVLHEESTESIQMLEIYQRMLKKKASDDEILWANSQFRDILKTVGLGALLILPFAPLTLPFFIKLSKTLGFNILPSSIKGKIIQKKSDNQS